MLILLINDKSLKKDFKMMKILNVNIDGPIQGQRMYVIPVNRCLFPFKDAKYHSQKS